MKMFAVAAAFAAASLAVPAAADPPQHTISVSANASVDYVPDRAHLAFAVRREAPSAQEATNGVNESVAKLVAAMKGYGIPDNDLHTANYSVVYQPPRPATAQQPATPASYVASESFIVTVPVAKTGGAIDRAVAAGANTGFGLSFDTTRREALFNEALMRATQMAHDRAALMARSAGVTLDALQSLNSGGAPPMPYVPNTADIFVARAAAPAVISAGTQSISASVEAVYLVR